MRWALVALAVLLLFVTGKAGYDTMRAPVVRHLSLPSHLLPETASRRIVLLADLHVAGPDMPPERLERIVAQVNALQPDTILIAGDFVSDKRTATHLYTVEEALAPLAVLAPETLKYAVPGNHDHWRSIGAIARELQRHGIGLLRNEVVDAGGLLIAGLDDDFTGRAKLGEVMSIVEPFERPAIFLSHSPDPFADLPRDAGVMLAGHTHCGQIAWPWGGSPATMSDYGERYSCGVVKERGNILVTSAGIGTSVLPFRLFTQPEIWVIDLKQSED